MLALILKFLKSYLIYFLLFSLYVLFSADGMLFGALARCQLCSGCLRYTMGMYRCCGYLSEWSKCSYSTAEPQRVKGKWKIPENTSNEYLLKVYKLRRNLCYLSGLEFDIIVQLVFTVVQVTEGKKTSKSIASIFTMHIR